MNDSSLRVAVVGAGLAGLSCAQALQAGGVAVALFDKSRGVSGRMSTRRGEGWQADHGAQYFTAREPAFVEEVRRWVAAGVAADWSPRLCWGARARRRTPGAAPSTARMPTTPPARGSAATLACPA